MSNETVSINGLSLCHKNSDGFVRSTLPDVCLTPPTPVPVPYMNVAFSKDLADGTTTVVSHGGAMNGIKGSRFAKSIGDEPGSSGGVTSGTHLHQATFLSWSPNVFMEGKPVTRLTDKMLLNKGNTISAGGYYTGSVTGIDNLNLNILCKHACHCIHVIGDARQACIEKQLMADPKNLIGLTQGAENVTGLFPELTFDENGDYNIKRDLDPSRRRGLSGSRPDVTYLVEGTPKALYEMKISPDFLRDDQRNRYEDLAEKLYIPFHVLNVDRECYCPDDNGKKEPVTAPAPIPEKVKEKSFYEEHPIITGVGAGVVIIAGGIAIYCSAGTATPAVSSIGSSLAAAVGLGGLVAASQ